MEDLGLSLLKVIYSALEISERHSWKRKVCMCVHVCVYRWVGIEGNCVEDTKIIKTDLKKTVSFVCLFPVRYLK